MCYTYKLYILQGHNTRDAAVAWMLLEQAGGRYNYAEKSTPTATSCVTKYLALVGTPTLFHACYRGRTRSVLRKRRLDRLNAFVRGRLNSASARSMQQCSSANREGSKGHPVQLLCVPHTKPREGLDPMHRSLQEFFCQSAVLAAAGSVKGASVPTKENSLGSNEGAINAGNRPRSRLGV